jgi:hypothetical protein
VSFLLVATVRTSLTCTRNVHDRQHPPDLLHLHGLQSLQDARPGRPRHPAQFRPVRDPCKLDKTPRCQGRLCADQSVDVMSRYMESQSDGAASDDAVGLAGMGGPEVLV